MAMIVMMVIQRQGIGSFWTKQPDILGTFRHRLRPARTADMTIEAKHPVTARHDDMKIVRDQKNTKITAVLQAPDQLIKLGFSGIIDGAGRLIENQKIGIAQQRAGNEHALRFAARERSQLLVSCTLDANFPQGFLDGLAGGTNAKGEKARDRHRHGAVNVEALRHVADACCRGPGNRAPVCGLNAKQHFDQRGFSRAIRADQRHDLARTDIEIDARNQITPSAAQP